MSEPSGKKRRAKSQPAAEVERTRKAKNVKIDEEADDSDGLILTESQKVQLVDLMRTHNKNWSAIGKLMRISRRKLSLYYNMNKEELDEIAAQSVQNREGGGSNGAVQQSSIEGVQESDSNMVGSISGNSSADGSSIGGDIGGSHNNAMVCGDRSLELTAVEPAIQIDDEEEEETGSENSIENAQESEGELGLEVGEEVHDQEFGSEGGEEDGDQGLGSEEVEDEHGDQELGSEEEEEEGGEQELGLEGGEDEAGEQEQEAELDSLRQRRLSAYIAFVNLYVPGCEGRVSAYQVPNPTQFVELIDAFESDSMDVRMDMGPALLDFATAADRCNGPGSNAYSTQLQRLYLVSISHLALAMVMSEGWFQHPRHSFIISKAVHLNAREAVKTSVTLTENTSVAAYESLLKRDVRKLTINSSRAWAIPKFSDKLEHIHLKRNPELGGLEGIYHVMPALPPTLKRLTSTPNAFVYPHPIVLPPGLEELTLGVLEREFTNPSALKILRLVNGRRMHPDLLLSFTSLESLEIEEALLLRSASLPHRFPTTLKRQVMHSFTNPFVLPDGLEFLTVYAAMHGNTFFPQVLPSKLLFLQLPRGFNRANMQFPAGLRHLIMNNEFNQHFDVPRELRDIEMGYSFDQLVAWTDAVHLHSIIMGACHDQPLDVLPASLKKLTCGRDFNSPVTLSEGLEEFHMGYSFEQPVQLPPGLLSLTLGPQYPWDTTQLDIPEGLKELRLEGFVELTLPASLERLTCCEYVTVLNDTLPTTLTYLETTLSCRHRCFPEVLPADITVRYIR